MKEIQSNVHKPIVAHIVLSLDYGGLESLVVKWTNIRLRRNEKSYIICLDAVGDMGKQVDIYDVIFCLGADRAKKPWDMRVVRDLQKIILENKITVLHSHNLAAMQYASIASYKTKTKHIYTQHGENLDNMGIVDRVRRVVFLKKVHHVVAVSESVKNFMTEKQWIAAERIKVVPNGVSVNKAANTRQLSLRQQLFGNAAKGGVVIGSVGRLVHVKGWDRFLPVFAELRERLSYVEIYLLLIGDGSERQQLEELSNELGLANVVRFVGFQEDVHKFLGVMDFFALPSRSEGLSVSLLEAMQAGKCVIATDVGENRTVLEGGKCGLILPIRISEWAQSIQQLLDNHELCSTFRKESIERVSSRYSIEKTVDAYEDLYH